VTPVDSLRSGLLWIDLVARGRRFKSCPRYQFQARNLRIPSLKAFRDLILVPKTVQEPGPGTLPKALRRGRCGVDAVGADQCGSCRAPNVHGDHCANVERARAAHEHRGTLRVSSTLRPGPCTTGAASAKDHGPAMSARTREGKPYFCAIKDVYSNRIVGCSIDYGGSRLSRSRGWTRRRPTR
jgi:hypothetical protein